VKHPCCVAKMSSGVVFVGAALAVVLMAPWAEAGPCSAGKLMPAATIACADLKAERGVFCRPLREERQQLGPGLAQYKLWVRVGPGEHDVITLHRVVAEQRPSQAGIARKAVFMIHGDLWGFEPAFLGLTIYADPPQASLPTFLARNGVDVWGISYRWAQIPAGFPDQSFMAGWGMDVAVSDARIGLRIARVVRLLTGQGNRGLHVLGWSRGVAATMALANAEATEPRHRRDIAGLIPVEGYFKVANEPFRESDCSDVDYCEDLLAAGTPGVDYGFQPIGQAAIDSPDGDSPYAPGLTNAQFAMGLASWPMGWPGMEWYHFAAGVFDESGVPTGLRYTSPAFVFLGFTKAYGFDPVPYRRDHSAVNCGEVDVPWDDHLARVSVPMFYLGAGGGFSSVGEHLTQLVGSDDVTTLIVRKLPEDQAALDIGHLDIFQAPASRQLFWEPILAWIQTH